MNDVDAIYTALAEAKASGYEEPSCFLAPVCEDGTLDVDAVLKNLAERLKTKDEEWLIDVGKSISDHWKDPLVVMRGPSE